MDVCLVNMPYAPIIQPSMALGLLQAVLERDGFSVRSMYANLSFTDHIGLDLYRTIIKTMSSDALRDWTFAHIAFPHFQSDHEEYLGYVVQRNPLPGGCSPEGFSKRVFAVRHAAGHFVDGLAERIAGQNPLAVGCTSSFNQHVPSLALLRRIRDLAPQTITLMGGANCEGVMGRTTHEAFPWVDYVVSGEADGLLTPLLARIQLEGRDIAPAQAPEGVFVPRHRTEGYPCTGNGHCDNAPRAVFPSLADLPTPNFDDYFGTLQGLSFPLRTTIVPAVPVEGSRGCWWGEKGGCTFCGLEKRSKRFRSKPAGRLLEELRALHQRYAASRIQAVDNVMDVEYFDSLLPKLAAARPAFRLFFDVRPSLNQRRVELMKEAGLIWVWAGIESLHDHVLRLMNKGVAAWQNLLLLKWCRGCGIYVGWSLMCDFPGEDDRWYTEMAGYLPLISHLQPPSGCSRVRLDRFSAYHEAAKEYGLSLRPARHYRYVYPLDEAALHNQVYFFEDEARSRNPLFEPLLERPGIRAVSRAVHQWTRAFYADERPVLSVRITDAGCHFRDTRPVASDASCHLEGTVAQTYLNCEDAPTRAELNRRLARQGMTESDFRRTIQELLDRKLLLALGSRLISLAVPEPIPDLPNLGDYPGGVLASPAARQRLENRSRSSGIERTT